MGLIGLIFFTIVLALFISSLIIDDQVMRRVAIKLVKISVVFLTFAACVDIVVAIILTVIGG